MFTESLTMFKVFTYNLHVFCFCCLMLVFLTVADSEDVNCDMFFSGIPWPIPKDKSSPVKLCQTQFKQQNYKAWGNPAPPIVYFATLFDIYRRTPLYSANRVKLGKTAYNGTNNRSSSRLWNRVACGLCKESFSNDEIYSEISNRRTCKCKIDLHKWQALNDDYTKTKFNVDRGHLTPSHINLGNQSKEQATFTLTNVAPQNFSFNRGAWAQCENFIEHFIRQHAPEKFVYIMTGVSGSARNKATNKEIWLKNNQVKVPKYFWKAVCFPSDDQSSEKS